MLGDNKDSIGSDHNLSNLNPFKWSFVSGGITAPSGFEASGVSSGLKASGKPDLALLLAPKGAVCAGAFTQSTIRAACVDLCLERIQQNSGNVRAVLINSGQANACTGKYGLLHSLEATSSLAQRIHLEESEVLMCSTGVIGEQIPISKLTLGLDPLIENLSSSGHKEAAKAILTTDLVTKEIAFECQLGDRLVRIGGMAKGSGMINPDMATMLAFLTCDVGLPYEVLNSMVKRVVNASFNAITVDGDTSTNDSFLAFAAGPLLDKEYMLALENGLLKVCTHLAKTIVVDGEGANCLVEVKVLGAKKSEDARHIAKIICDSSLVKTAIYGSDPNWGRILAAAGRAGVKFALEKVSLWIGPYKLFHRGKPLVFDRKKVSDYMQSKLKVKNKMEESLNIILEIGDGDFEGKAWGCDLSNEYIRINADYTT